MSKPITEVGIHTEYIQLDQLLKFEGIIETGGQIKPLLEEGLITINDVVCKEKRKKLRSGDIISIDGLDTDFQITKEEE